MTLEGRERPSGLYRSRNGMIFGVCRGVAEYLDFSVFWCRVIAVACFLFSGLWPAAGVYVLAALLMKPEPVVPFQQEDDREFYDSYMNSRGLAIHRLKRTFDNLDRRIRRIEDIVTARDYEWENRLNEGTGDHAG
ncbi:MAG: envelope stress response membrane protein PspC [Candidatus Hydrogenedentes bacterium]|nr:envelope stress response membrane protein PspC [Candidatus Hydrogenedentota bacterium]